MSFMKRVARKLKRTLFPQPVPVSEPKPLVVDVAEIAPLQCVASEYPGMRINLILPAVSAKHFFGGVATALAIFERAQEKFPEARLIISDETMPEVPEGHYFSNWPVLQLSSSDTSGPCIIACGDRFGKQLSVRRHDVFVATAWWTAWHAHSIQSRQQSLFQETLPFGYLIQDFEPGFYPWSTRYALAESTYRLPCIAIFNTKILADFFVLQGYRFTEPLVYEPLINPRLLERIATPRTLTKKRRILVYGRPSVERNAFPMVCLALREWASRFPASAYWQVVSAGEAHAPVRLAQDQEMRSVGKLSLAEYASLLEGTSIGISLMISPHPSYPPLEMAAFGCTVITNSYANKDLSKFDGRITSLSALSVDSLADAIRKATEAHDLHGETRQVAILSPSPQSNIDVGVELAQRLLAALA